MSDLNGRNVVVTGASGGLGGAVVEALSAAGAKLHTPGPGLDFTKEDVVAGYFRDLAPLWASVHLAGGFHMAPLLDTPLDAVRQQLDLNLITCFLACREAVRAMRGGPGRIVNVAARPVLAPVGGMVAYSIAKAGVAALTQSLAVELAEQGVLVNAVVPSIIDTPANRAAMPAADHAAWPKPAELARAIAFLVSPDNALTSGALVPVYGRA